MDWFGAMKMRYNVGRKGLLLLFMFTVSSLAAQRPNVLDSAQQSTLSVDAFAGEDICAKTNAAIVSLQAGLHQPHVSGMAELRGHVSIPAGTYSCATPIHLPHGAWVSGAGDGTFITWTGEGAAVLASDTTSPGEYVNGMLSDLHIRGTKKAGQNGIFVGGDATCIRSCTTNPSTSVGYNYIFRNITIYDMGGNGIQYGHEAFNLFWDNVHANNNFGYGLFVPHTSTGGGQFNSWIHSQLSGNHLGGWFIDQSPFVTFEMFGMDIQYNVGNDGLDNQPEVQGGHVICFGCHFEHQQGPFFSLNTNDDLQLVGGQLITVRPGVSDPYLILASGAARFSSSGTYIVAFHSVDEVVEVKEPKVASISVFSTTVYAVGMRFGGITRARGQGIRYEEPIDTTTQVPNVTGQRYFGGVTNFDSIHADVVRSANGFSGTCVHGVVVVDGIVTGCK